MKDTKNKQISILRKRIAMVMLVLIIGFGVFMTYAHKVSTIGAHALHAQYFLNTYIAETGKFPENQSDLEKNKILKIIIHGDETKYLVRSSKYDPANPDEPSGWKSIGFNLDFFSISYGIDLDDLEIKKNILVNKTTGKKCLLIDGPYGSKFPRHLITSYQAISRSWFDEYEHRGKK